MEIGRLYLGSIAGPLGDATPFNGYVIKHPQGAVLVDTGFGTTLGGEGPTGEYVYGEYRFPWVRRTTVEALGDHGVEAGDVKYIINTHLGDHSGDNHMFKQATFVVQRPEVDWARSVQPHGPQSLKEWDFPGATFELLEGEDAEVLSGIRCLYTPGHTPGHQSVVLDADGSQSLFCGDAVYTTGIWDDPSQITPDNPSLYGMQVQMEDGLEAWRTSVAKLAALRPDEIHFAHDANYVHRGHGH